MKREGLKELRKQFEDNLDNAFDKFHQRLQSAYEAGKVTRLYGLARYQIPGEVTRWVKEETGHYHQQVAQAINELIEEEEHNCKACEKHRQLLEGVYTRLKYPPVKEETELGPNNVFYQGFGAFGLIGGSIFVASSYIPYNSELFFGLRCVVSGAVGLFYGVKTYYKYKEMYRNLLIVEADKYLYDNKKRIREWFDQIIAFCEDEHKFCVL